MDSKNVTLKIWNPNVAACLSIIFTPIFGAWIHAKNWEVLKKEQERRWSMLFVYCLISVTIFVVYYQLFIGDVKSSPLSIGTLLTWYFILGKSQLSHIKDNNINYEKKSWIKPLLCGVGGYIILFGISISLITIAPLTKDDIKISQITSFLVGAQNRILTLRLGRYIGTYQDEPLLAIIPGMALQELWKTMGYVEQTLFLAIITHMLRIISLFLWFLSMFSEVICMLL